MFEGKNRHLTRILGARAKSELERRNPIKGGVSVQGDAAFCIDGMLMLACQTDNLPYELRTARDNELFAVWKDGDKVQFEQVENNTPFNLSTINLDRTSPKTEITLSVDLLRRAISGLDAGENGKVTLVIRDRNGPVELLGETAGNEVYGIVMPYINQTTSAGRWRPSALTPGYREWKTTRVKGYKFLNAENATNSHAHTVYNVPEAGQTWSEWLEHPEPASKKDGKACGSGGYHLMKTIDPQYAPGEWRVWRAEGRGLIGEDDEKMRVLAVRLRAIRPEVIHRAARMGILDINKFVDSNVYLPASPDYDYYNQEETPH